MILCDPGPLVAAFNDADSDHTRCTEFLTRNWSHLVVPSLAVTEICHLLADPQRRGRVGLAAEFCAAIADDQLRVIEVTRMTTGGWLNCLPRTHPCGSRPPCLPAGHTGARAVPPGNARAGPPRGRCRRPVAIGVDPPGSRARTAPDRLTRRAHTQRSAGQRPELWSTDETRPVSEADTWCVIIVCTVEYDCIRLYAS